MRGNFVLISIIWGLERQPLYRVERWLQNRGFLKSGDAVGTKVSVRNRQGGHYSGVAVKRGSTVFSVLASVLCSNEINLYIQMTKI